MNTSQKTRVLSKEEIQQAWDYWYPLVYGYFFRRVESQFDVEDLTAETLAPLFIKKDIKNPKAFVWQTARNQLCKFIKNKNKIVNLQASLKTETEEFNYNSFEKKRGF